MDTLAAGDFRTFLAYANLYCAQNEPLLAAEHLTLLVIAPRLTEGYRQELRSCGAQAQEEDPGIWRLQRALPYPLWLLETDVLAGLSHPLLTLFSPALLRDHLGVMRQLQQAGYEAMVVYMGQQVQQFQQRGEEFMMKHMSSEELKQAWMALLQSATVAERLKTLAPEERLQDLSEEQCQVALAVLPPEKRLAGLSSEQRLAGMSPEERLAGLPPEQRLAGMSPEERERLLAALFNQQNP